MPTPTVTTLAAAGTNVYTVHPDSDGHSVWTFPYFGTAVKKVDLNTSTASLSWTFPYSSSPATMEDGTVCFWQDSTGKVYLFTAAISQFSACTLKRLDPATGMTETGSLTLGSGTLSNGPEDWVVYQSGGQDFVAVISNKSTASQAKWAIINLTTMTLVGNGIFNSFQAAGNNERGWGVFKDASGNIWFTTSTTTSTKVTPHFYKSVSNGTPTAQFTVAATNYGASSFGVFTAYNPTTNKVFVGDCANVTGSNGFSGDISIVDLGTQAVTPIVLNASPFTNLYCGTFDTAWSCMRQGFASLLPSGTVASTICITGDVADAGATQRSGVANFFNPATLALQETYNVTALIKTAGFTPPTYSDSVRGTVTAPNGMLLWMPSLNKLVATYEQSGSVPYVLDFTVATPDLSVSPTSLSFTAQQGGANPANQILGVANVATGTLTFTVSDDAAWLSVSPTSGTAPQNLTVSIDITGLNPGTYTGHVTVTSAGSLHSPASIPVTLVVTVPPNLLVAPSSLSFAGRSIDHPPTQTLTVSNTTTGTLTFVESDDAAWLSVTPNSGTASQVLTVTVDPSGLTPGTYTGHITVTAPSPDTNSPQIVPVTLVVSAGPVPVPFTFLDPSGAPLAGGKVVAYLNMDIALNQTAGSQVMAKRIEATLDSNGHVVVNLWPNNALSPANSVYFIDAFTAQGQPAWKGQISVTG